MQALHIYLQLAGSKAGGGWPLSMFLTPDAKPLLGGTYFPPRDRKDGPTGFLTVLARVQEAWSADSQKWQKTGDALAGYVADSLRQRPALKSERLDRASVDAVVDALAAQYDDVYGGFGFDAMNPQRPKFPEPTNLVFLVDIARRHQSESASKMLVHTLEKMSQGGLRDHLGGGFHRYSTDRYWRVPHFEKMLYDNAQLVSVYASAWELAPRDDFRQVVDQTIEFMLRELANPSGAFYSALDAETLNHEGAYYVWLRGEIEDILSPEEFQLWAPTYGITGEPNFESRFYIPLLQRSLVDQASLSRLAPAGKKLLAARAKRPRPRCDTKILAGWNGLAIHGLADAGRILKNDAYLQAATRAADFVLANMRDPQGRLLRSYAGGQAKLLAYLDDYAYLVDGLIALHRATGEKRWLTIADELTKAQIDLFWDQDAGGFFYTSSQHEVLIARSKLPLDNATPSGNSVSAGNLVYLAAALGRDDYLARAEGCLQSAATILQQHPTAVPQLAVALSAWLDRQEAGHA
ncbi:MAG TPA: DUF255 domain-containing protein, partial [Pirellulales bacterium]|nr:DUF255 domain-containing protein [Pirellulales bacterium]